MTITASRLPAMRFAALLIGNVALALGPWLVRLADTGPVAAGFWRLILAVPLLALLARRETGSALRVGRPLFLLIVGAGVFFAFDLASWHVGIEQTRLGNAALFGNSGGIILMAWSLAAARRLPRMMELAAVGAALGGAALLMGSSLEISRESLVGDLFCLLAGAFYAVYILMLRPARDRLGQWNVLLWSTIAGAPVLLGMAVLLGEDIMPQDWTPLLALMLGSQVVGQGLLIYSLAWFRPLVIGLALLTQPAIAALAGWLAFGELVSLTDMIGMVLMAAALVLARLQSSR
ncbi:DMT family transporter [Croceicoccus sp. F390]|uniref:DMT family transporter n=1 Tax=Croceicoccus esteveae TaxID=3075597 RepID=A0ABU2ZGQ3_9SPHN|nr:DMT family transporter [Croceicoccus sp. F390]MDT0575771.1 DMT family transporter [Croceicoccus sp. F390]